MAEYSTDDLFKMQQDAMRRVQEMQSRARHTLEDAPYYDDAPSAAEPPRQKRETRRRRPDSHGPPKPPPQPKPERNPEPEEPSLFSGLKIGNINISRDHALILSLLLLLYSEDSDKTLMLALLYILF